MKPVLTRTWEGTWWHRTVAAAMLAAVLLAGYQAVRSIGDEDEEPVSRRAYDLECVGETCFEIIDSKGR